LVLVCDHRYPLAPGQLADRVLAALSGGHDVVVPTLPVTDTVKAVDELGSVLSTVDRSALRTVQYPRGFTASVLWQLISVSPASAADHLDEFDAALRAGLGIATVDGDANAFQVELPRDAHLLDAVIACRRG
jgi:2-C-methyl-D-erythritol 4-phosphate cytidylyltransferase